MYTVVALLAKITYTKLSIIHLVLQMKEWHHRKGCGISWGAGHTLSASAIVELSVGEEDTVSC